MESALRHYYQYWFPVRSLCRLLGREWAGEDLLPLRELCVETSDGFYLRWKSVATHEQMRSLITSNRTAKFHTGAVFNKPPSTKKKIAASGEDADSALVPEQRELVFDIDATDYAMLDVDKASVESCDRAWPVIAFGFRVVNHLMAKNFGFEHCLFVYSGMKGAHMSYCDKRACALEDEARAAIVKFLQPESFSKFALISFLDSPDIARTWHSLVRPFWTFVCLNEAPGDGLALLSTLQKRQTFMATVDSRFLDGAAAAVDPEADGLSFFLALETAASNSKYKDSNKKVLRAAVLAYVWPRLDENVSKKRNHLSKSVFSIHAKTGRVCIPMSLKDALNFEPAGCLDCSHLIRGEDAVNLFKENLNDSLSFFNSFIDTLGASPTEQWQPPRLLPSAPDTAYVYNPRKRRLEDEGPLAVAEKPTPCGLFYRDVFAINSPVNRSRVLVFTCIRVERDSCFTIPPGYSIPSSAASKMPDVALVKSIKSACSYPGQEARIATVPCCALFRNSSTIQSCQARLERVASHSGMESVASKTELNRVWDDTAIAAWLRTNLGELWGCRIVCLN